MEHQRVQPLFWGGETEIQSIIAHNAYENIGRRQLGGTSLMHFGPLTKQLWINWEKMIPALVSGQWWSFKAPMLAHALYVGTTRVAIIAQTMEQYIGSTALAGKVGCRHVKTRVKTTDMCLSGQRVADMLADMSATQHKKLSTGVPGQHVTACCLLTCWHYVGNRTNM